MVEAQAYYNALLKRLWRSTTPYPLPAIYLKTSNKLIKSSVASLYSHQLYGDRNEILIEDDPATDNVNFIRPVDYVT